MTDVARQVERALQQALDVLDHMEPQTQRARIAEALSERMRLGMEEFADQRTAALQALRDDDWSLADMKSEFGIARQRLSQLINRETYKEARRARRLT